MRRVFTFSSLNIKFLDSRSGDFVERSSFTASWFIIFRWWRGKYHSYHRYSCAYAHLSIRIRIQTERPLRIEFYFTFSFWVDISAAAGAVSFSFILRVCVAFICVDVCVRLHIWIFQWSFHVRKKTNQQPDSIHFRRYIQSRVLLVHSH